MTAMKWNGLFTTFRKNVWRIPRKYLTLNEVSIAEQNSIHVGVMALRLDLWVQMGEV